MRHPLTLERYESYDVWLLMAIRWSADGDWEEIIGIGDGLNHAIFMPDELNYGMNKLIFNGWAEEYECGKFRVTKNANDFFSRHKKRNEGSIAEWLRMKDIFLKIPATLGCPYKEYISDADYKKAVKAYRRMARQAMQQIALRR